MRQEVVISDIDLQLLQELRPPSRKNCYVTRSVSFSPAWGSGWRCCREPLVWPGGGQSRVPLAKVTRVTVGPCFPAPVGLSEGCPSLAGSQVPPLPRAHLLRSHATGARFLASPCCCSSWGRLLKVRAQSQDDQFLFLCHTGCHQKGIIALQTLVLTAPLGQSCGKSQPRPGVAIRGAGLSSSLCSVTPSQMWI